jgi:hypothetical protein
MSNVEFTIGGSDDKPTTRTTGNAPKSATGRKPGRPTTSSKQRDNVAAALSTMESAYSALSMGALMLRKPLTAEAIARGAEQWQASNRQAFEASPKLASVIAGVGQTSGVAMFAATNIIAMGTILITLRQENAIQAAERAAEAPADNE